MTEGCHTEDVQEHGLLLRFLERFPVPPFRIEWGTPVAGWIDAALVGESRFELSAGCYDPFPNMIGWVRRCNMEQWPQSFLWDAERAQFLFTYYWSGQYLRIEEVKWEEKPEQVWEGFVSLQDLNKAFYRDFWRHIEAPEFAELEWFGLTASEILGRWQDVSRLEDRLVKLDRGVYEQFWNKFNGLILEVEWGCFQGHLRGEAFGKKLAELCVPGGPVECSVGSASSNRHKAEGWDSLSLVERRAVIQSDLGAYHGYNQISASDYPRIPELDDSKA